MKNKNLFAYFNILKLNKNFQPVALENVEGAFTGLYKGAYKALNVIRSGDSFDYEPLDWERWSLLIPNEDDLYVNTPNSKILIPSIVICSNYAKIPIKYPFLSKSEIFKRDGWTCCYTGKALDNTNASVDHIIPLSKGGKHEWGNVVTADRRLNSRKGSKTLEEAGLKLLKKPGKPIAHPVSLRIPKLRPEWEPFFVN